MANSACSSSMSSGGARRSVFSPAPRMSRPFAKRQLDHAVAQIGGALLRFLIAHELDADHQAFAANVADDLVTLAPIGDAAS